MKKYIIHQDVCAQQFPKEHETFFKENSSGYSLSLSAESLKELQQFWTPGMLFLTTNEEMFIPPVKEKVFDVIEVENLQQLYFNPVS